ncbi:unsaturated chondroitin disaccharide hydrolase [Paucibacter oligotrophus]|uniref:Unsaturated chondroitin disaccharide hydrolase n=1 Tax=Roseateles oligotrophus TaxID=1769250 RepID=A0A840LC36_9BURK|nr:glycoside hydrolase family 88 protein [Roseateles oligotrophus]MBB4843649.1 unsaturated chondroitin disaccharide hydrolase [Roseateles oligotrophus]
MPTFMTLNTDAALQAATAQLGLALRDLGPCFPGDTSRQNHFEPARWEGEPEGVNSSWTAGFWTGLLWLAHELSGEAKFAQAANEQIKTYAKRLERRFVLDHHDLGFLFMPSCVAALRQGPDRVAQACALQAAELLMTRYLPGAGVIQAWGRLDDASQRGRIIIDCLLNLPLLYWASAQTGEARYADAARSHALRSKQVLVRPDATTFHTFHFDPHSGAPLHGTTQQGAADDSCWARGQAWGLYGFALNHRWAPELELLDTACLLADRFLAGLPEHGIACWDLSLADQAGEPWDSSASAIAACGLLELSDLLTARPEQAAHYRKAAERILAGLLRECAGWLAPGNVLLRHGVYSRPEGLGVDEANLWGDFFFLEALARHARAWSPYWHPARAR